MKRSLLILAVFALPLVVLAIVKGDRFPGFTSKVEKQVAANIATELRTLPEVGGSVEARGNRVTLLDGKLELTVSERREDGEAADTAHFHIVSRITGAKPADFDACLFGLGEGDEAARSDVVKEFVHAAFPVVLSHFRRDNLLGVDRFSGTESWGVPGFRGYAGPLWMRGTVDADAVSKAPLFELSVDLPRDGQPHMIKTVAYVKDGAWIRTVELDSNPTTVTDRALRDTPATGKFGAVVRFGVFQLSDARENKAAREEALTQLRASPWMTPPETCPTEVMPEKFREPSFSEKVCQGGRLLDCVSECEAGSATSCFSAAFDLQPDESTAVLATSLFLRACQHGEASGCTNAAADRIAHNKGASDVCAVTTFDKTCERASDPWACTMFGSAILHGDAGTRDLEKARRVLGRSCRSGEGDPACEASKQLLGSIDAAP